MIIYVDILQKLAAKGWTSYRLRKEKVLPESVLTRIRKGLPITTDTVGKICELLECQPAEILKWKPGE